MLRLLRMCVWNSMWVWISYQSQNKISFYFDRNKISFQVIKYHVNTTRNEISTRVHQNIESFWNAAEMKIHGNRTCFHAGLKSQTGMCSFCLSCERTVKPVWVHFASHVNVLSNRYEFILPLMWTYCQTGMSSFCLSCERTVKDHHMSLKINFKPLTIFSKIPILYASTGCEMPFDACTSSI